MARWEKERDLWAVFPYSYPLPQAWLGSPWFSPKCHAGVWLGAGPVQGQGSWPRGLLLAQRTRFQAQLECWGQ